MFNEQCSTTNCKTTNFKLQTTMSLEQKVMAEMKDAMKSKDEATLRGLRAIKAEIIKAKTEPGAGGEVSSDKELSMLQKMMKQRKDSLEIYQQQNRPDLAKKEEEEIAVIEKFLPKQLSAEELKSELQSLWLQRKQGRIHLTDPLDHVGV